MTELHDILNARTKRLEGNYSYKLAGPMMYGMDVAIADESEPNESEMSFWLPYADGNNRDGVGDLLEIGGIELDRHRDNAINLFDHGKHLVLPIGMTWARNEKGEYDRNQYISEIDVVSQRARDKVFVWQGRDDGMLGKDIPGLKEHAITCEQYFHMVCMKMLGCGSIGYQIIDGVEIPPDYSRGTPKGVHLRRVKKLESSLVVLPANQNTAPKHKGFEWVREVLAMPRMCGKPLSPMFVKSFSDYCPEQTKTVVGFADVVETKSVEVPIPHGDLNDSKIPPAKWKPGAGAIKRVPEPTNINPFQPGQTVTARKILTFTDKVTGRVDTFARTGDKLEVVNVTGDGALATVRRPDGKQIQVTGASIRRSKGMSNVSNSGSKGLPFPGWDVEANIHVNDNVGNALLLSKDGVWKAGYYDGNPSGKLTEERTFQDESSAFSHYRSLANRKSMPESKSLDEIRKRYKQLRLARARKHAPKSFKFLVTCKHEGKSGQFEVVATSMKDAAEIAKKCSKDKCGMPPSSIKAVKQAGQIKMKSLGTGVKGIRQGQKVKVGDTIEGTYSIGPESAEFRGKVSGVEMERGSRTATYGRARIQLDSPINFSYGGPRTSLILTIGPDGRIEDDKYDLKSLEVKGKAMEDEEVDLETSPDETLDKDDWSGEPFGSQVLRRLHEDKSYLMKTYDGFMGLLDHEPTKGHLGSHMEYLEKFLGDTEKLHGKHYKHLSPIGGKTKDLTEEEAEDIGDELEEQTEDTEDDPVETEGEETEEEVGGASENETVESDSSESDAPTPDEALEGMDKKDKKGKSLKVVKKKAMCPECGKEGCSCNGSTQTKSGNKWGLQEHEMKSAGEANDFMGELSSTQDFSDEHRMKSYHYHKTLEGIGQMGEVNQDLNQDPAVKSDPGSDQWQQEEMEEPEHQGNEFQKMCKDMSGWYKQLSQTRDFGDPHRKRCGMLHKAMSDMMNGAETEEVAEDDLGGTLEEDIPGDLGGMDEKALLNYERAAIERSKQIAALAKQVAAIRL